MSYSVIFGITCRCETEVHKKDIIELVSNILKFHNNKERIIVIDSCSPDKSYFYEICSERVVIHDINNTEYEIGTIKFIVANYVADKYIFLQDSISINSSLEEYYIDDVRLVTFNKNNKKTVENWYGCNTLHIKWVKDTISKTSFGDIPDYFEIVFGCSGLFDKKIVNYLYTNGLKDIKVKDKIGSCGMERVLGIGLYSYGIKNFKDKLFDSKKVEKIWRGRI